MRISIILGRKKYEIAKVKQEIEVQTVEALAEAITKNDWSPYVYQDAHPDSPEYKHRIARSMCGGDIFGIDIDADLSIDDAIARVKKLNLTAIVAPTKSHRVEKNGVTADRFRIIFPLSESIVMPSQVRPLFEKLKKLFPEMDDSCKDAARIYFASTEIAYIHKGDLLQVPDFIEEINSPALTQKDTHKYPLAKSTYEMIKNGAEPGHRNTTITAAIHDAIQQQWTKEELLTLFQTSPHEWLYDTIAEQKIEERYRNFTPAHAPRPAAPAIVQKSAKMPLSQIKGMMLSWLDTNGVNVSYNRTLYLDNRPLIAPDLVRKIVLYLAEGNMAVDEHILDYYLHEWIEERRKGHLEMVQSEINGFDLVAGRSACDLFLSVFCETRTPLDVEVLRHMIWQVKRKINAAPTKYEMMLVFTGGQGAGKSHGLREYLFKPLGDLAYTSGGFDALSDQRESRLFSDHYLLMFDEMTGAQKTDMERVKQIITSGVIKQRRMGTTSHDSIPMNATFFGTANSPLDTLIRDNTGMRRFYEIKVDAAAETSRRWDKLKQIDYKALWKCADETNEHSPIEPLLSELQIKQETLRDKNIFEWLMDEGILAAADNLDEYTSALALTHVVSVTMGQNWSSKTLSKEWKRFNLPKHRTNTGVRYGVKILDTDILHTLRTKYNMKLGGKDGEGYTF